MSSIHSNSDPSPSVFHRPSLLRLLLRTVLLWREEIDDSRQNRSAFGVRDEHRAVRHRHSGQQVRRRAWP